MKKAPSYTELFVLFVVVVSVAKEDTEEIAVNLQGRAARCRAGGRGLSIAVRLLVAAVVSTSTTIISASAATVITAVSSIPSITLVSRRDCRSVGVFQIVGNDNDITVRLFTFAHRRNALTFGKSRMDNASFVRIHRFKLDFLTQANCFLRKIFRKLV